MFVGVRRHFSYAVIVLICLGFLEAEAQMVAGEKIPEFENVFKVNLSSRNDSIYVRLIDSSIPGNILWPAD
ncbi:MAG: hypothetical protein ACFCUU_04480, partial [Cyclobacteriaceae bacterium]